MEHDSPVAKISSETESSRTSTRTSARLPPVEVITRGEPRRRWSVEQKQAIAAESLMPGASPTVVARRYGISSGLLYTWRKALVAGQPNLAADFARVEVAVASRAGNLATLAPPLRTTPAPPSTEVIEIILPDCTTLRVPAGIDPRALRRLLGAVRR